MPSISIKQAKLLPFNIVKPVLHEIEFLIKIIFPLHKYIPLKQNRYPKDDFKSLSHSMYWQWVCGTHRNTEGRRRADMSVPAGSKQTGETLGTCVQVC